LVLAAATSFQAFLSGKSESLLPLLPAEFLGRVVKRLNGAMDDNVFLSPAMTFRYICSFIYA